MVLDVRVSVVCERERQEKQPAATMNEMETEYNKGVGNSNPFFYFSIQGKI